MFLFFFLITSFHVSSIEKKCEKIIKKSWEIMGIRKEKISMILFFYILVNKSILNFKIGYRK